MAPFDSALRRIRGPLAMLAAVAALSGVAVAQQYKPIRLQITPAQANVLRPKVASILRQPGAPTADELQTLDDFFTYYYSAMTDPQPEQLALLSKSRKDLFQQFLNLPNGGAPARDHVLELTIKAMKSIAKGNYHPAARYNAALVLGQLDKTPARTGAGGAPAVPLPAATAALVELMDAGAADPVAVSPPVVVGALVGLERHARLGVDPALADQITKAALAVATSKEPAEGVSKSVFGWMRSQAGRVLASQFVKGGLTPPVHDALVKLVGDKELGLDDRCAVAEVITTPMYKTAQGVKIEDMVAALGGLAKDVLAAETKKAEKYQEKMLGDAGISSGALAGGGFGGGGYRGGGYGGYRGGGFEGGRGGELPVLDDTTPHYEKRRMLDRILAVATAADALAAAGSPELKTRLEELTRPIHEMADAAVKSNATDAGVVKSVLALAGEVNRIVAEWTPAAAPPAEAPAGAKPPAETPPAAAAGN